MVKIGSRKVVNKLRLLINIFFISFIINLFIVFYSVYLLFDMKLFHNLQGSKLKLKNNL